MNAVFFRFTLGNGAKASKAFQLALAVGIPEVDLQGLAVQTRIPSKTTMSRGSVYLDMAYLLYCQDKWKQDRHLMFMWADSSPQSGRNWLMSMATPGRADKILEAASAATYLARTRSDWSDRWEALDLDLEEHARMTKILNDTLSNHTFLPVALGSGKGKVEDKSSALLQALALECSSRAELKDRLDSIVAWTTDMGTELTVPLFQTMSFEKLLPSWLHQSFQSDVGGSDAEPDAQELPEASSLMPRSLIVPGGLHITDNLLTDMHTKLEYWDTFWSHLQPIVKLLEDRMYRERFLATCVRGTAAAEHEDSFQSMGMEKLYSKRWQVVIICLTKLLPMFTVFQQAWDETKYLADGDTDGNVARGVTEALDSSVFCSYVYMVAQTGVQA